MSSATAERENGGIGYELSTNLAELPSDLHWRVVTSLNSEALWKKIIGDSTSGPFSLK